MSKTGLKGKIYDIQGFSVHDGPGVRTTVYLKGCPLRCPWCHSPESQSFHSQMSYASTRCTGVETCGECMKVCPAGALEQGAEESAAGGLIHKVRWHSESCAQCFACTQQCFAEALSVCGKDYTVEEVMQILRKDYDFLRSSGGGVTVSGGEALSQEEFTVELLRTVKADGIHTALDTTGFAPWKAVEHALPCTDLFLYDLKHMDSAEHERVTGVPNEQILENARRIAANGGKLQVRIPVIPGFNDSIENLNATASFCAELGEAVTVVQLLPFHHMGASKYERIQRPDPMPADVLPPDDGQMQKYLELMFDHGLQAMIH